jgi:hypothetical protein
MRIRRTNVVATCSLMLALGGMGLGWSPSAGAANETGITSGTTMQPLATPSMQSPHAWSTSGQSPSVSPIHPQPNPELRVPGLGPHISGTTETDESSNWSG